MRSGISGVAVTAIILGVLTVLFGGLYFHARSENTTLENTLMSGGAEVFTDQYGNGRIRNLVSSLTTVQGDLLAEQKRTQELQGQIGNQATEISRKELDVKELQSRLKTANEKALADAKKLTEANDKIREEQNRKNAQSERQIQERDRWLREAQAKANEFQALAESTKVEMMETVERLRAQLSLTRADLARLQEKALSYGGAGRVNVDLDRPDGKILEADLDHRVVVVSLGRIHNVRRGMRFTVMRNRFNRRDTMGEIEITDVQETTATAIIAENQGEKLVCPETGWVAPDPEMRISPWVTRDETAGGEMEGGGGDRPVYLVKVQADGQLSMNPYDPILKGDEIFNPFYSPDRALKFLVVGEPVQYDDKSIALRVRQSGGEVVNDLSSDVDFVILCRIPELDTVRNDKARGQRRDQMVRLRDEAKLMGIPELREVDLMRFLEN